MCESKWVLKVFVIGLIVRSCHLIRTGSSNGTAEILWKLSHQALLGAETEITGRQGGYGLIQSQYPAGPNYQQEYLPNNFQGYFQRPQNFHRPYDSPNVNYPIGNYIQGSNYPPGLNYPLGGNYYPQRPSYLNGPYAPNFTPQQSIMHALTSIAQNDELHCVPKLLCELTSGSRNSVGKQSSFLPFNINMESLLGLLSAFNGAQESPLLLFGRAALLGYTSSGNSAPCTYSYPRCPSDPNKLVNYLNNYNGGFFRYFNGLPRPPTYYKAEQRILTKPYQLASANPYDRRLKIKFPVEQGYTSNEIKDDTFYKHKSEKKLTFPEDTYIGQYHFRGPKTLSFPVVNNGLDFQRPLPNHIASPVIFPTRTGTGELILDSDAFEHDYGNHYFY